MKLINTTFRYDNTFYAMHTSEQKNDRLVSPVIRDLRYAHAETPPARGMA